MASRNLKNRIKSTKNIRQMTRAMEAVSAVKMRRSVALALSSRPYVLAALRILRDIRARLNGEVITSPYFKTKPVGRTILVVITSDKGLAGPFNASVINKTDKIIASHESEVKVVAIGKKGRDYYRRKGVL